MLVLYFYWSFISTSSEIADKLSTSSNQADIIIIGAGLSGLQLLNALLKEEKLADKKIILLEANDAPAEKTWCFWEKGSGQWDHILHHEWKSGWFYDQEGELELGLDGYSYKMVRSVDFIAHFQKRIQGLDNVELIHAKVSHVDRNQNLIHTDQGSYTAEYIFDSSMNPDDLNSLKGKGVLQHFKGWFIEFEEELFNADNFTMMDFRYDLEGRCSFIYILPTSSKRGLIEYTFFDNQVEVDEVYEDKIKEYLSKEYPNRKYTIVQSEKGVIPMSSYAYHKDNGKSYMKIGTAGGWVKASSGYSFKHAEKKAKLIARNLKDGKDIRKGTINTRFRWYDRILLSILQHENELGNQIFREMYRKNRAASIFQFLDEDTNLSQEKSDSFD